MYTVQVKFSNGDIEIVGKYENKKAADEKAEKAKAYYADYGGEVLPLE